MIRKVAVMQPYFFPYIGYYQLVNEVDRFIFYDDVKFITRGWINRNKILINGEPKYITIPCKKASQNRLINNIQHSLDQKEKMKILNKISYSYSKAPFFKNVFELIKQVVYTDTDYISEVAEKSISLCCEYLEIDTAFLKSSKNYQNQHLRAEERILDICKEEQASRYINPIGGKHLYDRDKFKEHGMVLEFLKPKQIRYQQNGNSFIDDLSIIDVMMFNDIPEVNVFLNSYELV